MAKEDKESFAIWHFHLENFISEVENFVTFTEHMACLFWQPAVNLEIRRTNNIPTERVGSYKFKRTGGMRQNDDTQQHLESSSMFWKSYYIEDQTVVSAVQIHVPLSSVKKHFSRLTPNFVDFLL